MKCAICGTEMNLEQKFCPQCGSAVGNAEVSNAPLMQEGRNNEGDVQTNGRPVLLAGGGNFCLWIAVYGIIASVCGSIGVGQGDILTIIEMIVVFSLIFGCFGVYPILRIRKVAKNHIGKAIFYGILMGLKMNLAIALGMGLFFIPGVVSFVTRWKCKTYYGEDGTPYLSSNS